MRYTKNDISIYWQRQFKNKIKEIITFTIASGRIKHLGIDLTTEV